MLPFTVLAARANWSLTMATENTMPSVETRIREAFAEYFDTLALIRAYSDDKQHPIELGILACARLDSLANLAGSSRRQQECFTTFVEKFSGQKNVLQQVAVPNMYSHLTRQRDLLPGTIAVAGRVTIFDRTNDNPFINFISKSGLPITVESIEKFIDWLRKSIQKAYRVTATQSRSKPSLEGRSQLIEVLRASLPTRRQDEYRTAIEALSLVISQHTVSNILYREFRSGLIHEFEFSVYRHRFFREPSIYWQTIEHIFDSCRYLDLQFSARWFIETLESCLNNYIKHLEHTKKLPPALYMLVCNMFDELQFLDESLIDEPRDVGLQFGR